MIKSIKKILLVLALIICVPLGVYAEGSINISAQNLEIEKGKTATFTVSATNAVGKVTATSSDANIVTITPLADGTTSGWVDNYGSTNDTVTYTVNAKSVGTTTIKVVSEAGSYDKENLDATYTINVTVKETTEQEVVKTGLSKLVINGKEISLKDGSYEYGTPVANDVTSAKVEATLKDATKTSFVTGYGSRTIDNLKEGKNEVLIKVKQADNTEIVYTIYINRAASESTNSADINKWTIDVTAETGNAGSSLTMKVNGNFPENSTEALYYVKFVKSADEKITDIPANWSTDIDYNRSDISKWKMILTGGKIDISDDWYLLKGYENAYFMECTKEKCTVSDKAIKVERPELPEITSRYHVFLFEDTKELSVFPYFPYMGENGAHKIIVKIGVVEDEDLLYSIYKKDSDALGKLMEYAKSNEGKLYSFNDEDSTNLNIDDFEVENGKYYYIYTTYENTDGMYRDLSDVAIAMGESDMLVNDVEWNYEDVENPKTGDKTILLVGLGVLFAGVAVVAYRKTRIEKSNI